MTVEIIALLLASPVVLAIVNAITNWGAKTLNSKITAIEEGLKNYRAELEAYKIEQATQDFRQKNWLLIETGTTRRYSHQQWYMLKNNLARLLPEEKWSEELKEEAKQAEKILRGEKI